MAKRNLLFHPLATKDYEGAIAWYSARSVRVALAFEREVERTLQLLRTNPEVWPSFDETHRRVLLRRFPYLLVYELFGGTIWIVAVMHAKRRPRYWVRRRVPHPASDPLAGL